MWLKLNEDIINLKQEALLMFFKREIYDKIGGLNADKLIWNVSEMPITKNEVFNLGNEYESSRLVVDVYWNNYHKSRKSKIAVELLKNKG